LPKKSSPSIGFATLAKMKLRIKCLLGKQLNCKVRSIVPACCNGLPSAEYKEQEDGLDEAENL